MRNLVEYPLKVEEALYALGKAHGFLSRADHFNADVRVGNIDDHALLVVAAFLRDRAEEFEQFAKSQV